MAYILAFGLSRQEACEPEYPENIAKRDTGQLRARLGSGAKGLAPALPGNIANRDIQAKKTALHVENRRARRSARTRRGDPRTAIRIKELRSLERRRYPDGIPDTEDGLALVIAIAHHLAFLPGETHKRVGSFLRERAPWLGDRHEKVLDDIAERPHRLKAKTLGRQLKLTEAERFHLRIKTFRSIDGPSTTQRKRQRDKARKEQLRRERGGRTRAEYRADARRKAERRKAEGVSRTTEWRHLKAGTRNLAPVKQVGRQQSYLTGSAELVSQARAASEGKTPAPPPRPQGRGASIAEEALDLRTEEHRQLVYADIPASSPSAAQVPIHNERGSLLSAGASQQRAPIVAEDGGFKVGSRATSVTASCWRSNVSHIACLCTTGGGYEDRSPALRGLWRETQRYRRPADQVPRLPEGRC